MKPHGRPDIMPPVAVRCSNPSIQTLAFSALNPKAWKNFAASMFFAGPSSHVSSCAGCQLAYSLVKRLGVSKAPVSTPREFFFEWFTLLPVLPKDVEEGHVTLICGKLPTLKFVTPTSDPKPANP